MLLVDINSKCWSNIHIRKVPLLLGLYSFTWWYAFIKMHSLFRGRYLTLFFWSTGFSKKLCEDTAPYYHPMDKITDDETALSFKSMVDDPCLPAVIVHWVTLFAFIHAKYWSRDLFGKNLYSTGNKLHLALNLDHIKKTKQRKPAFPLITLRVFRKSWRKPGQLWTLAPRQGKIPGLRLKEIWITNVSVKQDLRWGKGDNGVFFRDLFQNSHPHHNPVRHPHHLGLSGGSQPEAQH